MGYKSIILYTAFFCFLSGAAEAQTQTVREWLKFFKIEARAAGISQTLLSEALPESFQPIARIVQLDRKQPEKTRSFDAYRADIVNQIRIDKGRAYYREHKNLLHAVGAKYGVDPQFVVALWGIETNYGKNTGGYDVIHALATLAYDGRRAAFFRDELLKALRIVDQGHISHAGMKGSWAGAMGQCQFMPSSFLNFAEDYNGDGRRDIWTTREDVFASAANYLGKSGWKKGQPWGRAVSLPKDFNQSLIGLDKKYTLQSLHDAGVRSPQGKAVPYEGSYEASLVQPGGKGTDAYIVYDNYRVIMKWNKSTYFATSVGLLADRIKAGS